ncbi:hypothetical protein TGFOU_361160 [Toxoplasma gondii FOU]|uniref:Uncharacterized protein n=1 Tax=Toxoplasma gondii FOU TaxID=943167 RepID=A0A086JGG2_TOXGO|nr:hypothetical protein TGFOU_361160 [Toxoplasma gondii FOU]
MARSRQRLSPALLLTGQWRASRRCACSGVSAVSLRCAAAQQRRDCQYLQPHVRRGGTCSSYPRESAQSEACDARRGRELLGTEAEKTTLLGETTCARSREEGGLGCGRAASMWTAQETHGGA